MGDDTKPIGEMFERLIDDGKAYGRAELNLARAKAERKLRCYKGAAILGALAGLFALAAIVCLCLTLVLSAAVLIGPLAGGLVVTILVAGIALLLGWLARREMDSAND